jgi:hypothetical protein
MPFDWANGATFGTPTEAKNFTIIPEMNTNGPIWQIASSML